MNYEAIVKTIHLSADEVEILKTALLRAQETAVPRVEALTIECLLDKLDD